MSDGRYLYLSVSKPMKMGGEDRIPFVRWKRLEKNQERGSPGRDCSASRLMIWGTCFAHVNDGLPKKGPSC